MSEQRSASSRRGFLGRVGTAAAGGTLALGGCTAAGARQSVSLLVAGSLANALEHGLRPRTDVDLRIEAHGSATVARFVSSGQKDPDIVSLADPALFDAPMSVDEYTVFATNAIVLAYDPESPGGEQVATAGPEEWYHALMSEEVRLGRTDPRLDPLGYRTLFTLDLASEHYGTNRDLRTVVPARDQVYPETQLLGGFETGSIDAAFVYRNMADTRGYTFHELPPEINLSDPAYTDRYRTVAYELPERGEVRGDVIRYGATLRSRTRRPRSVFKRHVTGEYLTEYGFGVPERLPTLQRR